MALPYKFNFRDSAGFVTDGAGETYVISNTGQGENYPTARDGITFGWNAGTATTRDRDAVTPPVQFAGMHRNEISNLATFRVDLPSAGSYTIRLGAGDYIQAFPTNLEILDNATSLFTLSGSTSGADRFKDATGTEYSSAAWAGSNTAATHTFATTTFIMKIGNGAAADTGCICHLEIAAAITATPLAMFGGN